MPIDPAANPLNLSNLDAGQAGWDATIQDAIEVLAPQDKVYSGNASALEAKAGPLRVEAQGLVRLRGYDIADLPAPGSATSRCMAWVNDPGSGGPRPAYCDGTNWRWYADDSVVN